MNTIGNILKEHRKKNNLLIRELAAEIEIDPALLCKYENGYRLPTKEQINKIAEYFNININKILTIWLSDKIVYELSDDTENALGAMKVAEKKFKYLQAQKEKELLSNS
ncbi:MAG: helix-turn-helix transcriptional regulator [Ignavibacteriae bacterium]|nr:helix-turn-helix transcriptional regulator [Ignavibacteriota bacterium]